MNRNKDVFIFSTRYIFDRDEAHDLFSSQNMEQISLIDQPKCPYLRNYLFCSLLKYENEQDNLGNKLGIWWNDIEIEHRKSVVNYISNNYSDEKTIEVYKSGNILWNEYILDIFAEKTRKDEFLNILFEKKDVHQFFKNSPYLEDWSIEQRFFYCRFKGNEDREVYVVPQLPFTQDDEHWIRALTKQFAGEDYKKVYLILHNRDLLSSSTTFRVLDKDDSILAGLTDLKDRITVALFQHDESDKIAPLLTSN
ncbi:MAG: hypothetical protein LIP05_09495, partial [Tannerellaceae bacterium]|nr:hypothetical protein [Tannerellaceae bacterium]